MRRRQMEAQEAQARVQLQAQNLAKLSRRPEEVLRDLEQEAEVLKNLHHKISQQLHMLQVRTSKAPAPSPLVRKGHAIGLHVGLTHLAACGAQVEEIVLKKQAELSYFTTY
jgi:hypothetical protein